MQCTSRALSRAAAGRKTTEQKTANVIQVEQCFHQSIQIARQQRAKSLEHRASTSMARLYRDQGRHEQARNLLSSIYDTFTEGFGTVDLREAKALPDDVS
jgi:predicted ATPase